MKHSGNVESLYTYIYSLYTVFFLHILKHILLSQTALGSANQSFKRAVWFRMLEYNHYHLHNDRCRSNLEYLLCLLQLVLQTKFISVRA